MAPHTGTWREQHPCIGHGVNSEELLQDYRGDGPPARRQLLKRRCSANCGARLGRAILSRFVDPERQEGPGRPRVDRAVPGGCEFLDEADRNVLRHLCRSRRTGVRGRGSNGEFRLQEVLRVPSPAAQKGPALAADGAQQATLHATGKLQAGATSGSAFQEQGRFAWQTICFASRHLARTFASRHSDIRIETGKSDWHRLVEKPVLRPIRVSGSQGPGEAVPVRSSRPSPKSQGNSIFGSRVIKPTRSCRITRCPARHRFTAVNSAADTYMVPSEIYPATGRKSLT